MTIKRVLILTPIFIFLFLLQSYFWVPSYEQQTRGNPDRLHEYITASSGDAGLLNPILSADSASSQIESMVFEGLLDRDEELRLRGRLAESWDITENAYFYVNESARIPGAESGSPEAVAAILKSARKAPQRYPEKVAKTLRNIRDVQILAARPRAVEARLPASRPGDKGKEVVLTVAGPPRIRLQLSHVDPEVFQRLRTLLGEDYFSSFSAGPYVKISPPVSPSEREALIRNHVPATEHNPVIDFRLRPGVRFQDGHVFNAHDVRFTYDAIMDPRNLSPRVADYEPVKAVEVVDPLRVRVIYKRLYSPAIGTWGMGILPEHLLNGEALQKEARRLGADPETFTLRDSGFNRRPVGCGPFQFKEWKSDQYIILERFEDYWEGAPNYKRYITRIVPDLLTQEMEFYAGTLDSYNVQPHQVKRLSRDPAYQSFSGTSFGYSYIGYNMRRPPFDDRRVRRALGMAINVNKIIEYVLYGQGERITGPFVKQTDYYNHRVKPLPYDPEGALALLAEAGWRRNADGWLEKDGNRLEFTLITNSGNDLRKAILAVAQDAWKQIGVAVETDVLEWSVFIQERVNKLDFDALILGWVMGIDPDLYQIWHSSQTHPYQLNFVGFKNAEADRLIIDIRREYDHARQVEDCHHLHEIIAREQPYTFLYVSKWTAVLDKRVVIQELDEDGEMVYKKIQPTKTGNYTFYFNKWIKIPEEPQFATGD